jgi:hypothetical protein
MLLVAMACSGPIIAFFWPGWWSIWAAMLVVYLVGALIAAVSASDKMNEIPGVLLAFFILHFAYGLGYWKGLMYFGLGRAPSGRHHTSTAMTGVTAVRPGLRSWIEGLLLVIAAVMPIAPSLLPILIGCLAVLVIVNALSRPPLRSTRWSLGSPLPFMALLYVLHIAGMAWTTNTAFGAFDLQVKAGLLLFPLLFCCCHQPKRTNAIGCCWLSCSRTFSSC